jgi:hypothetical protein
VDIVGRPHTEDDGTQEDAGGEHRPNPETDRGRNAAKGVQPWAIARYASLKSASPSPARQFKPRHSAGLFIDARTLRRRYVNLLRMAGFAWHRYPETASKPHLSNEVGGAIILASQQMECFVTEFLKITECARSEQMTILPFLTSRTSLPKLIDSFLLIRKCSQLMECSDRSGARGRAIDIYSP